MRSQTSNQIPNDRSKKSKKRKAGKKTRRIIRKNAKRKSLNKINKKQPETALAAFTQINSEQEATEFFFFITNTMQDYEGYIKNAMNHFRNFQIVLLVNDGPKQFKVQEILWPEKTSSEAKDSGSAFYFNFDEQNDRVGGNILVGVAVTMDVAHSKIKKLLSQVRKVIIEDNDINNQMSSAKNKGVQFAYMQGTGSKNFKVIESLCDYVGSGNCSSVECSSNEEEHHTLSFRR